MSRVHVTVSNDFANESDMWDAGLGVLVQLGVFGPKDFLMLMTKQTQQTLIVLASV